MAAIISVAGQREIKSCASGGGIAWRRAGGWRQTGGENNGGIAAKYQLIIGIGEMAAAA